MKKSLIFKGLLVFMATLMFVACKDDEPIPDANKAEFEVVEYENSTEDRLTAVILALYPNFTVQLLYY